ncbi:hypothetical protein N0V84_000571 [Fusarium piperis]|uniref:Xylanolytic transcriptional activator regulatory domain-containing protein n=1 Tax=Fusarium piperis TaxID=1435070 RepID=A0A9W9BTF4_9HYPO|nr:hypothetical protein N0V84_000571 [Fusarium piperis]
MLNYTPLSSHNENTVPSSLLSRSERISQLVAQLPPVDQARKLFDHFTSTLQPSLCILHIPSAREILERTYCTILGGQGENKIEDLLLLFSIFAGAALSWTTQLLQDLNATKDNAKYAFETYTHLATTILDDTSQPVPPSTTALAATATLAHIVINSDEPFPAKALALRLRCYLMARSMLLHRLDMPSSKRERILQGANSIEVEVQRRVWWSMVASDWLSNFSGGPQEGVYTFIPRQMRVNYPSNVDDEMMKPFDPVPDFPLSTPTRMTCFLHRLKLADLCREIVDAIPPMMDEFLEADYEVILGLDKKLNDLLNNLPVFFRLDAESIRQSQEICRKRPYLTWQRIVLHFGLHARICRLHRSYHLEGWWNPKYAYSRSASLHSAHQVLELRRMMDGPNTAGGFRAERFWMVLEHVTMAAVTLGTDLSFNPDAPDAQARKEKILVIYKMLEGSKKDTHGLIKGIEKNMQLIMATIQPQQGQTEKLAVTQPSPSMIAETRGTEPEVPRFYGHIESPGEEQLHQLWSDFLAVVPDLQDFEWTSLLNDFDMDLDNEL